MTPKSHGLVLYLRQQTQERTETGSCLASIDRLMDAAALIEKLEADVFALKADIAAFQIDSVKVGKMRELESALRGLMTAVTYAAPTTLKFGEAAGPCYEARVPEEFILRAEVALGKN